MSGVIGRLRSRQYLRAAVSHLLPWLLSVLLHAGGLIGLGLVKDSSAHSVGTSVNSIELTLALSDYALADQLSRQIVIEAAARAPELLAPPSDARPLPAEHVTPAHELQAHGPGEVVPAAYSTPALPQPLWAIAQPTVLQPNVPQPKVAQPTTTQFFGVRAAGTRFVYVIDRSASMEGRPMQAARRELMASLATLTPRDRFQIVCYNDRPLLVPLARTARQDLLFADDASKRLAAGFLGGLSPDGSTNHLAALLAALELRPDVIFLLTDSAGSGLLDRELAYIRQVNRGAAIHSIEIAAREQPSNSRSLERLAIENGGQHTYIDLVHLR
jgi:hypothetical protein